MPMTYNEVIEYLFARLPMFTRDGASALKKDTDNTLRLCQELDNPQNKFKSIHIAGTNGKGSTSHMLASILAVAGYKTGLYTSPHLVDFRERIRINGKMISEETVVSFVQEQQSAIEDIQPSFFEVTVAMAFDYFAKRQVDIAIVEVGLGGRLDSTNIIHPELCVITNIGMDHMNILGDTLEEIAYEKAGIIKKNVPVVISERNPAIEHVFIDKAVALHAPLRFASDEIEAVHIQRMGTGLAVSVENKNTGLQNHWLLDLSGLYQRKNVLGVLVAIDELRKQGWKITDNHIREGLSQVKKNTGLLGRWHTLSDDPLVICDTGHNEDGIREVVENIKSVQYQQLHIIIGAMRDKDLSHMLPQMPSDAIYYFCHPDMPRALPSDELREKAVVFGLQGEAYPSIRAAMTTAKDGCQKGDLIFIGGSNFVVAEALKLNDQ